MSINCFSTVGDQFSHNSADFRQEWLNDVMLVWNRHYPGLVGDDELRHHAGRLLDELMITFAAHLGDTTPDLSSEGALATNARELGARRVQAGFTQSDAVKYTLATKNILTGRLLGELGQSSSDWLGCLSRVDDMLERAPLLTFEDYEQSLSLTGMFTPIIHLWDQLLMLPLVGPINRLCERQLTIHLVEDIARYKAKVILIDVTGVPAFDTCAVDYIMKTVDVAQSLETRVVMSGIRANDARSLSQARVGFANVCTRTTLRDGIVEAFQIIGLGAATAASAGPN